MVRGCCLFSTLTLLAACGGDGGGPGAPDAGPQEPDAAPPVAWSHLYGGAMGDNASALARAPNGDLLLGGSFSDSADFGGGTVQAGGQYDGFLARYTAAGDHIWSKGVVANAPGVYNVFRVIPAASSGGDLAETVTFTGTIDLGGGPLTSSGARSIVVARLTADGAHVWSRAITCTGATSLYTIGHVMDDAGRVVVAGTWGGTCDFGDGSMTTTSAGADHNAFLVAYDAGSGPPTWSRFLAIDPPGTSVEVGGIALEGDEVVLAGDFTGSVDAGGGPLTAPSGSGAFVGRWRTDTGAHVASFAVGDGTTRVIALGLGQGGLALAGFLGGPVDFAGQVLQSDPGGTDGFVVSVSPAGAPVWAARIHGGSFGTPTAVLVEPNGNVTVAGSFSESGDIGGQTLDSAGATDAYWARYAPDGTPLAATRYGLTGDDVVIGMVPGDDPRQIFLAGQSNANGIDFGQGPLTTAGNYDVFLASIVR